MLPNLSRGPRPIISPNLANFVKYSFSYTFVPLVKYSFSNYTFVPLREHFSSVNLISILRKCAAGRKCLVSFCYFLTSFIDKMTFYLEKILFRPTFIIVRPKLATITFLQNRSISAVPFSSAIELENRPFGNSLLKSTGLKDRTRMLPANSASDDPFCRDGIPTSLIRFKNRGCKSGKSAEISTYIVREMPRLFALRRSDLYMECNFMHHSIKFILAAAMDLVGPNYNIFWLVHYTIYSS